MGRALSSYAVFCRFAAKKQQEWQRARLKCPSRKCNR